MLYYNTMTNLQLSDREKTAVIAALESQRSRKQAVIESGANHSKAVQAELRQPDNQYDILSAEHTLMHAITLLAKLTGQPPAHFANPNPSQDPPIKTHLNPHVKPNQQRVNSVEEAERWFLQSSSGSVLCVNPDNGDALECDSYPAAKAFFAKSQQH